MDDTHQHTDSKPVTEAVSDAQAEQSLRTVPAEDLFAAVAEVLKTLSGATSRFTFSFLLSLALVSFAGLTDELHGVASEATPRLIRTNLENKFGFDLTHQKQAINEAIDKILADIQVF